MNIHIAEAHAPEDLCRALSAFETQFEYPLGEDQRFSIDHGADYTRFFRAMGRSACVVAELDGKVFGTLTAVVRRLLCPDGAERSAAYIADLKVSGEGRTRRTFWRLIRAIEPWIRQHTAAAYGVVMAGTSATPDNYTGRAGVPQFDAVGELTILRIAVEPHAGTGQASWSTDPRSGSECFRRLVRSCYAPIGADSTLRSEVPITWLAHPQGTACGALEDTHRAKRLRIVGGEELRSGHLSFFAFTDPADGAAIIDRALALCAQRSYPALFVAVPRREAERLQSALNAPNALTARATVYGVNFPRGHEWNISTAEI